VTLDDAIRQDAWAGIVSTNSKMWVKGGVLPKNMLAMSRKSFKRSLLRPARSNCINSDRTPTLVEDEIQQCLAGYENDRHTAGPDL
jgi:hypothetical protein